MNRDRSLFDDELDYAHDGRGNVRPVAEVRGLSRFGDRDTSRDAAQHISRSCEDAIRKLFTIPRSLSDDEICALMPEWHPPTVISARSRLSHDGFLVDSGTRRLSKRGRRQIVWSRA